MAVTPEVRTTEGVVLVAETSTTPEERVTQSEALVTFLTTPDIRTTQSVNLVAMNFPSASLRTTQTEGLVMVVATPDVRVTQTELLVAFKVGSDERTLRGWTFTQDDHDFYVLQLFDKTYIFDKLTEQWCQWISPNDTIWRGADGCDWEGLNVCCDPDTGQVYKIDPDNRLDYTTTPIVSQVFGGMTERFRNMVPCFLAEVAISQAHPPAGIDPSTVGIRLRTSDTLTWTDHGTITGQASGNRTYARFYGLGLLQSPGVLFEITDYGYARRIDGLNIEIGGTANQQ
jgi:hypothetical protein